MRSFAHCTGYMNADRAKWRFTGSMRWKKPRQEERKRVAHVFRDFVVYKSFSNVILAITKLSGEKA